MFKSLSLLSTVMVACIASPNVARRYSKYFKLYAATIQGIPKIKQIRQMQTLIPHEAIQVVSR